jgi:hypothetical protein
VIAPKFRDYFAANVRRQFHLLEGLPMGWSLSPFHFSDSRRPSYANLRRRIQTASALPWLADTTLPQVESLERSASAQMLRYFDDFLFFVSSKEEVLLVRHHLDKVIDRLGLSRYPAKGYGSQRSSATTWAPTSIRRHDKRSGRSNGRLVVAMVPPPIPEGGRRLC